MTIEEYLEISADDIEDTILESEDDDLEARNYLEGKRDAYRELLEKLSSFDHEVTLREIQEMCNNRWVDGSECDETSCCLYENHFLTKSCPFLLSPPHWDIYNIQRRIKEARK